MLAGVGVLLARREMWIIGLSMGLLRCFLSLMGFYSFSRERMPGMMKKFFIITGLVIVILIVAVGIIMGFI